MNLADGERVSLNIESKAMPVDDLNDVADLLDVEYAQSCRRREGQVPSLEEVRSMLSAFEGSLADRLSEERDER